jgi:hypothetical protein
MGLDSLLQQNIQNAGLAGTDRLARNAMFPQSQMDKTQYATSSQLPTGAATIDADYDTPTNAYTGLQNPGMASGGIATLRYDEGGDTPSWDPASGQVTLQKYNTQDPSADPTQVAYTIPKDSIKQFVPNDEGLGGQYILKDGSTMYVGGDGTVQSATPGRGDYTLNDQGYYQPTGANLTWNGQANLLTKNIGGVDVQVPGIYTKGGYQDAQGNLRTDANGVPIALAPNYLDSGSGKSGLSDAAPFIAAAAMAAMGAPTEGMLFEGMVPASETLMGGFGAGATGAMGPTYAELGYTPDYFGGLAGTGGAAEGLTAAEQAAQVTGVADAMGPTYAELGYQGANAKSTLDAIAAADAASKAAAAGKVMTAAKAAKALTGLKMLTSGMQSTGTQPGGIAGGTPVAAAPTISPTVNQFGVTGYSGDIPTSSGYVGYTPTLSKIKGATGDYSFAAGGPTSGIASLGSYSDGGQLLKGPGDGMSDNIPAKIGNAQPARLADGEFVIPADVVSHLGNGSTDAGAKQLYAMMDRIRKARTGNKKQGKQINPSKFLP